MNARDLVADPSFLAYRFNFDTETVSFLPISNAEIERVSCLKLDYIEPGRQMIDVPIQELLDPLTESEASLVAKPPKFIFHTAFCASTFLSRCLNVDGVTVSLREPQILLDAANAKRFQWRSQSGKLDYNHLPKLALLLLQKHATAAETLLIKPINSVNNIIPELMQATSSSKSLMMFTDARNFVMSTLKKGEGGKQTVRSMFDLIRCDFPHLANLQLTHTIHMTDLRITMTLWRLQIEQATQLAARYADDKTMASLYGEVLIDDPLAALTAVNDFLQLGISAEQLDSVVKSDAIAVDAKLADQKFSKQSRDELYQQLQAFYGDDINDGLQWLLRNNAGASLQPEMAAPLPV